MKKLFNNVSALILSSIVVVGVAGCDNSSNSQSEKIELTLQNYTQYIDVKERIKVNTFSLRIVGGVYLASGTGTLTYTVYPKQPVKCYNVSMNFSNKSPYGVAIGIDAEFTGTPYINVPADGNATETVDLELVTNANELEDLNKQVLYYDRTESDMINTIENFSFPYGLSSVTEIKGYVVVE